MELCTFLNIYPESIEAAAQQCEAALEKLGFSLSEIDDMYDFAKQDFEEIGSLEDITNSIISCLYSNTETSINERFPFLKVRYYVDGYCSSFEVDDLPEPPTEDEIRADWEKALNTMNYGDISRTIEWGFTPEDLRELLRLHRANTHRQKIEDLLEDCNFHTFCACLSEQDYAGAEAYIEEFEKELNRFGEEE